MPELPDVEGRKRYVARYATGRRVRRVHVPDAAIVRNTSPQGLGRALVGRRLGRPERRGKWLLTPAGRGRLVFHFGMSGALAWTTHPGRPDRFDRVVFALDGGELRYRTRRRLGGIWWVRAGGDVEDVTGPLGPDAAGIGRASFRERLAARRGGIKAALMDQRLLAGIGNELSDEVLWRARVRPGARVQGLPACRLDLIHRAMRRVLRASTRRGRIPRAAGWLEQVRGAETPRCPRCGTRIRRTTVAGRTSYWCPRCQP